MIKYFDRVRRWTTSCGYQQNKTEYSTLCVCPTYTYWHRYWYSIWHSVFEIFKFSAINLMYQLNKYIRVYYITLSCSRTPVIGFQYKRQGYGIDIKSLKHLLNVVICFLSFCSRIYMWLPPLSSCPYKPFRTPWRPPLLTPLGRIKR